MACASVNDNNAAIEHINNAIRLYDEAKDDIKVGNSNELSDAIIDKIESEKNKLLFLRGKISTVNSNITTAMNNKEKEED